MLSPAVSEYTLQVLSFERHLAPNPRLFEAKLPAAAQAPGAGRQRCAQTWDHLTRIAVESGAVARIIAGSMRRSILTTACVPCMRPWSGAAAALGALPLAVGDPGDDVAGRQDSPRHRASIGRSPAALNNCRPGRPKKIRPGDVPVVVNTGKDPRAHARHYHAIPVSPPIEIVDRA